MAAPTTDELAAEMAQRCAKSRQHGSGWMACCPAHEDTTPSLSITPGEDKVLLKCHAGCTAAQVVAALGLTLADLFTTRTTSNHTRRIVNVYDYHDAQGHVVHQTVRYAPKDFKQRRPDPANPGAYIWSLKGIEPVLYHLPDVLAAVTRGETVYLCEGEKDVKALRDLGLVATCNAMGAGKWHPSYTATLCGGKAVLLPDNDLAGRQHTVVVTTALHGTCASLKVVELPGLPDHGGDVSDWLKQGGTVEQLQALVGAMPDWQPAPPHHDKTPGAPWDQAMTAHDFLLQQESEAEAHVKDLVLPGCITILAAPRSSGKTIITLYLGVALAIGGVFRREHLLPLRVLVVDRDNPPSLIRKRLRCLGAQHVTGLKVLTRDKAPPLTDKAAWAAFPFQDYDVVIIDSVGAATEGVSEKEGAETQRFLATLKDLARRGPALLCLDNTNKAGLNYRGRGEKGDAVDILYECRNATGWTPSQAEFWWESLPDYGEHAWKEAATRHRGQDVIRLAFIPTKFRMGIEPEPFILEVDTRQEPWTLADVTETLRTAGAQAAEEASRQERGKLTDAEAALVHAMTTRPTETPFLKREAEDFLLTFDLTRKQARTLLERGGNRDVSPQGRWVLRQIIGYKSGRAMGVYLAGTERAAEKTSTSESASDNVPIETTFSAVGQPQVGRERVSYTSSDNAAIDGYASRPQPSNYTAENDMHNEKQSGGHQDSPRFSAAPNRSSEQFVPTVPNSPEQFVPPPDPDNCPKSPDHQHAWKPLKTADFCPWCLEDRPQTSGTIN
jgi:hypothetical protein